MWTTVDGDHRRWTRTGTQPAKPFARASRERNTKLYFKFVEKAVNVRHSEWESQGQNLMESKRSEPGCGTAGTVGQTLAELNDGPG